MGKQMMSLTFLRSGTSSRLKLPALASLVSSCRVGQPRRGSLKVGSQEASCQ
jgi:hypothetical protein